MGDTAREGLHALTYRLRCRAALACWRVLAPDDPPDFPPPLSHLDGDTHLLDEVGGEIEQLEVKVDKIDAAGLSTPSDILAEDDDILWDRQLDGRLPATEPDRTEQGDEP
jgi:hypothetical protein